MDEADRASDREQVDRDRAIAAALSVPGLKPTGDCHWCHDPVDSLFCSPECRDDWQRQQDARTRNGS